MVISNSHEYVGYSEELYDDFQLTSQYLEMRDGVKLAIDIYRPVKNGKLHKEPLPVIWAATKYRRAVKADNPYGRTTLEDNVFYAALGKNGIARILRHGYVIAILDVRGSGASYGHRSLQPVMEDFYDLYDVNEWLASRTWCSGKTGMFGTSFLGRCQYMTALMGAPSLKCIVPMVCQLEYPAMTMNGIMNISWINHQDSGRQKNDKRDVAPPVDEDMDESMLRAALEEHKVVAGGFVEERQKACFFNSYMPGSNRKVYMETYFPNYLHILNASGVAVYIWGGWMDFQAFGSFQWYQNLTVPKKLVVGSWVHSGQFLPDAPDWTVEHLRWYDYWLKGIDNGIMDEPPVAIQYSKVPCADKTLKWSVGLDKDLNGPYPCPYLENQREWRYYRKLPINADYHKDYYFDGGISGTVHSINDGKLAGKKPESDYGYDEYKIDYQISKTGFFDRNMFHKKNVSLDYTLFDERSVTYTSSAFSKNQEFAGFPVVELWFSTDALEIDFYVTVEEIDMDGISWLLSDGKIRSSFRKNQVPPFDNMGLPWHSYNDYDQEKLIPGNITKIEFALFPLFCTVAKGHCIRVTINHADCGNWDTPVLEKIPNVRIFRCGSYASKIRMPVLEK